MKQLLHLLTVLFLSCGVPFAAVAADNAGKSGSMGNMESGEMGKMDHGAMGQQSSSMIPGEVKKIQKDTGKITLKHGPMKDLNMPAMTMVFRVKDPAMLSNIKVGDQVNFMAEKANGALVVTAIEVAK